MIVGSGNSFISPRTANGGGTPAPPFAGNSAYNGLSVDPITGQIVFGNDVGGGLADFVSDREIDMAGFLFQFLNGADRKFIIDNLSGLFGIGDFDNGTDPYLLMQSIGFARNATLFTGTNSIPQNTATLQIEADNSNTAQKLQLDLVSLLQTSQLLINNDPLLSYSAGGFDQFVVDQANGTYRLGDIQSQFSGLQLNIDELNGWAEIGIGQANEPGIWLDFITAGGDYGFGNFFGNGNGTYLSVTDGNEVIFAASNSGTMMQLNNASNQYTFGQSDGQVNGLRFLGSTGAFDLNVASIAWLEVDPIFNVFYVGANNEVNAPFSVFNRILNFQQNQSTNGQIGYLLDYANRIYQFGGSGGLAGARGLTVDNINNLLQLNVEGGLVMLMDASAKTVNWTNGTNDVVFNINGNPGFTGTVSPVNSITVDGGIVTSVS